MNLAFQQRIRWSWHSIVFTPLRSAQPLQNTHELATNWMQQTDFALERFLAKERNFLLEPGHSHL